MTESEQNIKIVTTNRKAFHDYEIITRYEAGLTLVGTEVKSLRLGKAQLMDAYASVENGEVFLHNMHISQYDMAHRENHDPVRKRRLLLTKREIRKLWSASNEKGFTIVPLKVYFKGPYAKVEIAVARGKRSYDKRQAIAKRDAQREMERKVRGSDR
ncbi:MAG: SsrA-binding protein SmpB [candidate division Zixibacteria bacterium]|nr:SsrA-binding protein SmpB [candidate division Zixibacteria bacterium]